MINYWKETHLFNEFKERAEKISKLFEKYNIKETKHSQIFTGLDGDVFKIRLKDYDLSESDLSLNKDTTVKRNKKGKEFTSEFIDSVGDNEKVEFLSYYFDTSPIMVNVIGDIRLLRFFKDEENECIYMKYAGDREVQHKEDLEEVTAEEFDERYSACVLTM